jgi:hypothetical protein
MPLTSSAWQFSVNQHKIEIKKIIEAQKTM